jgi:hypothetical protein
MDLIRISELDASIRRTDDGRISVYDLIQACGNYKAGGERKAWLRLADQFPEVVAKCHTFKFPGRGQQNTPVTDREGALHIIGLLPGAVGRSYREAAAKLVVKYLDASPELAEDIISRSTTENVERIKKFAQAESSRRGLLMSSAQADNLAKLEQLEEMGQGHTTQPNHWFDSIRFLFGSDE